MLRDKWGQARREQCRGPAVRMTNGTSSWEEIPKDQVPFLSPPRRSWSVSNTRSSLTESHTMLIPTWTCVLGEAATCWQCDRNPASVANRDDFRDKSVMNIFVLREHSGYHLWSFEVLSLVPRNRSKGFMRTLQLAHMEFLSKQLPGP